MSRDDDLRKSKEIMDSVMSEQDDVICWVGTAMLSAGNDSATMRPFAMARMLIQQDAPVPGDTPFPWPPSLKFSKMLVFHAGASAVVFAIYDPQHPDMPLLSVPWCDSQEAFVRQAEKDGAWAFEMWTPSRIYKAMVVGQKITHTAEAVTDPDEFRAQCDGRNDMPPLTHWTDRSQN